MLAPKAFLDALSDQASRLFSGDTSQPRAELESQFKALLQSGFSKLELVSREEFDSQMVVLARTRARLEALEAKVAEMEARLNPPAAATAMSLTHCNHWGLPTPPIAPKKADSLFPAPTLATPLCLQRRRTRPLQ
mgnify:CR=1 FL=1